MDATEHDVLACMAFPARHRAKLHATNPIERLDKAVKRRAHGVGVRAFQRTDGSHARTPERAIHRRPIGAFAIVLEPMAHNGELSRMTNGRPSIATSRSKVSPGATPPTPIPAWRRNTKVRSGRPMLHVSADVGSQLDPLGDV